jgi:signal transduction histidine kinase
MAAQPDALDRPRVAERSPPGRDDRRLVRVVARLPWRVRTKLLVAFAGIVALFLIVGALGLRALGQSNGRVERLGTLQQHAATYQVIQTQAQQLRQMLGLRVGANNPNFNRYNGLPITRVPGGHTWTLVDQTIQTAASQLAPSTSESTFGFTPPAEDEALLEQIRLDYRRFFRAFTAIIRNDVAGAPARKNQPILASAVKADTDLGEKTNLLATRTRAQTDALIAANRSAYTSSRNLFVGVGTASVALALLLGFVLSWSVTGPIQRTDERLAEIASGDFSRDVDVPKRDELGALAENLNRMNDELKRLYEELETVSRHKSEFLANMSHELRTPLNAIIGFSEVLQQQMFGELNEQQLGYVGDVLDAGRHLLSLINDILDLAKVEAGRMELDLAEVSLAETLRSGLTMHGERARGAGVSIALEIEPDEIVLEADERKLRQVVFNLLSNAVKFTPPGGRIDVSAQVSDGMVEVAVADTGSGIAPEDQELVFEEFGQARGESARQEGTGLGLPLARRFIELHGGRLWVESQLGAGSTFRFTLPVKQRR